MAGTSIEFGWRVAAGGYRWVQGTGTGEAFRRPQPALVETPARAGPSPAAARPPERAPALHRAFAELDPGKDAIRKFANAYGNLGVATEVVPAGQPGSAPASMVPGTFLATWRAQIGAARRLVGLWDLVQRRDLEALAPHICWQDQGEGGPTVCFESHPEGGVPPLGFEPQTAVIASRDVRPELLERFKAGEPLGPAQAYLLGEIDLHLREAVADVAAGMGSDERHGRPTLRLVCPTLRSAVWLQLADAVAGNRTFGKCQTCGRWFEVAPDVARSHRRYCTDSCRVKAYRGRQVRARQMHHGGKTFEEIAEALDSDVATIKRWVTGFKE